MSRLADVDSLRQKTQRPGRFRLHVEELESRLVPTLLGQQLFPADHAWNQPIANAPVAANSAAIMNNIISRYGNGRLHPDFSQHFGDGRDLYGVPFNIVRGNSTPKVTVVLDAYSDESDPMPVPVPPNAVLEGDYQDGPRFGVDNRGDSHLLIWDADNNVAYEFFRASRPSENGDGKWHADQETVWDMKTNTFRTLGWTSADAAGLSILAGLVRPDEALPVSQGGQGVINHAIRFTLTNSIILDQFIYPASHTANPGNNNPSIQPPMGARFRLKADVDISQLNPQSRIVAQAMKDYGMIVADNGSNFFFTGASYSVDASNQVTFTWDDEDVQDTVNGLKSLRFDMFEVVDLTPVVSGLSLTSGPAGTSVTVIGQSFSGAADQIQVLFGNTPATSVTVLDDGQVRAIAPAGAGTVDVRVQSGVTTASNSDNLNNPIFGYGISAISAADRFTYTAGTGNQAPSVATPASAAPSPVTGVSTMLSVLGADDAGEANLTYTWTSSGPASVTFSHNGANAAKNVQAAFTQTGAYSFTVTITDADGLSTTSSVSVPVLATVTTVVVTPAEATVKVEKKLQFFATAYDQFGAALTEQPTFTWSLVGKKKVNQKGIYRAPARKGGPYTVTASAGGVQGSASVTVVGRHGRSARPLDAELEAAFGGESLPTRPQDKLGHFAAEA